MLKFGNKEFRNLQEQVGKNMRDIQNIMQGTTVLAEFGIKVIGQVDTAIELPDPATYEGDYGDAYVVGTEEPYEYYIFTRAFEGQDEPSWFDLGIFPVPGPQGEQGPEGPQGPQGQTGATGQNGTSAGFGTVSATATTLPAGSDATVSVSTSGTDASKNFAFTFGIPEGEQGSSAECVWGSISGDLSDQTDLVNAFQTKQNSLVSGTNIKTINNESILGSGNLTITAGVSDVEVNGTSVVTAGVAEIDLTDYATTSDISDMATETWVGQQGYLTSVSWSDVSGKPSFATVATSGDYDDLTNKPTIPAAQVNSDWNAASGVAQILNKPSLATVATSGSYADLSNKPTIPTDTSDLNNDSGFITSSDVPIYSPVRDVQVDGVSVVDQLNVAEITLPTMTLSETAAVSPDYTLASITINGDVWNIASGSSTVDWSDITNKPSFATVATTGDYDDLTNKPTIPVVPTTVSSFTNDAGYITSSALSGYATETWVGNQGYLTSVSWNDVSSKPSFATVATSGSYNDLTDKPTIPTVDYPVTDVQVDGTSVVTNKVANITRSTLNLSSTAAASPDYILASLEVGGDTWNLPSVYKDGDKFITQNNYFNVTGYITNGSKQIIFTIVVPKLLTNISTITLDKFNIILRGVGGYVNGSAYKDYVADSSYTITALKTSDNTVTINIIGTAAFSSATNNTPINATCVAGDIVMTFNE